MIIVENGTAALPSSDTLRRMFADRKDVFVDLLKWDVPVVSGCFELDQFDNRFATYIILGDRAGDHLGSARLLPTTRSHLLTSLFPDLCAAPPPTGAKVMEISRFCLSRRQKAADRRETRNRLVSALVRYALEEGIETYTGVAEIAWLQQILAFGWDCRPLGPPVRFDCGLIGALAIRISSETPRLLAQNGVWCGADLSEFAIAKAA
jgi:acyl-homoserine lactone synthase